MSRVTVHKAGQKEPKRFRLTAELLPTDTSAHKPSWSREGHRPKLKGPEFAITFTFEEMRKVGIDTEIYARKSFGPQEMVLRNGFDGSTRQHALSQAKMKKKATCTKPCENADNAASETKLSCTRDRPSVGFRGHDQLHWISVDEFTQSLPRAEIRASMPKRTFQPNRRHRAKTHGFLTRMKTKAGAAVLSRRRAKGRHKIAVSAGFRD